MDIVLGVSMTPTTVRMVLVEGTRADGLTVDHDAFDVSTAEDSATPSEQVISAILGTQQSALAGGHRLIATGVTWTDHDEAAALREGLEAHGIEDVMLVSELHAAGALARTVGRAVGYDKTALMLVDRDTATLSVVESFDGSIVKVLSRSLHSADAMAVMTEMVTSLEAQDERPQGLFVVGSGVDVTSVKDHLENLVSVPVSAPEDSEIALARGAAIAAANAPRFEASTVGLAYSQDPDDGSTAGDPYRVDPAFAATQLRAASSPEPVAADGPEVPDETRRPFLLVGSALTSIFVIGVVALVISLAVSIRPTADQRPNPGENVVVPSAAAPAPPKARPAAPAPAPAAPPSAPETIPAPVPVVQEQPQVVAPRTVVAVPQAPAPAPAAPPPAPAPAAPPPAPEPAAPPPPVVAPAPIPVPVPVILPPGVGYPAPQQPYQPPGSYNPPPRWYPHQPPKWRPPVDDDDPPAVQQPSFPQQPVAPQQPWQPSAPQMPVTPRQPPIIQLPQLPKQPSVPQCGLFTPCF